MLTEKNQKGSVFGAAMLISGCCVGAGMLGMPVVTREAGFAPASLFFLLSWLFMTCSGLVLLEVALWFPSETNIAEMAKKYLGKSGEIITFGLMLFLMYALMTAYSSGSGSLISDFSGGAISPEVGTSIFATILTVLLVVGTRALDLVNRLFMIALIASYFALIYFALPEVQLKNLTHTNWTHAFFALPIMIVSFGFQNLVPSLVRYLDRDYKKIQKAILLGSLIPLAIYLVWEFIVLGLISAEIEGLEEAQMATSLIRQAAKGLDLVLVFADSFAFFAIATSFMGNALSVMDFLSDQAGGARTLFKRAIFALLATVPPVIFAVLNPDIFLSALGAAGSFSATILFGLIPALICLKGRRDQKRGFDQMVSGDFYRFPGGSMSLMLLIVFSLVLLTFS